MLQHLNTRKLQKRKKAKNIKDGQWILKAKDIIKILQINGKGSTISHIETWSKPVNIYKTFERVQYIPILTAYIVLILILPSPQLNVDKNCPPKCTHISTQH